MTVLTKRRKLTLVINHILLKTDKSKIAIADNCKMIRILDNSVGNDHNPEEIEIDFEQNIRALENKGDVLLAVTKTEIYKIDWSTGESLSVFTVQTGKLINKFQQNTLLLNDGTLNNLVWCEKDQRYQINYCSVAHSKGFRIATFLQKPDFLLIIENNLDGLCRGRLLTTTHTTTAPITFNLPKIPDMLDCNQKFGVFVFNSNQLNSNSNYVQLIHLESGLLVKSISTSTEKSTFCKITEKNSEILLAKNNCNNMQIFSNNGRLKKDLKIGFQSNVLDIRDEMMCVAGFGDVVEVYRDLVFRSHCLAI